MFHRYYVLVWHVMATIYYPSIHPSGFITAVAVFRKPNAIPLCFYIDLFLNFLLSLLLVLLPSTFFLDVLFFFSPMVPEAWCSVFWHFLVFSDERGAGPLHQPPNLEDQVIFGQGFLPLALDKSLSNCQAAVLVLVHAGYFISSVPTISGARSPIRHLGRSPMGD